MRALAQWALLFGAYLATLGIPGGDEPAHLAVARALRRDGELLADPHGLGLGLLLAPLDALGGTVLVQLAVGAAAALGFVLAAAFARRVVPEPWASWAALAAGLSPPALAYATTITPAPVAGALLAGAALCALRVRERPLMRSSFGGAAMLAALPWLDPWLLVPALPVAALLARWTARRGRPLVALGTVEIQLASLVFYVSLNGRLYGGFTPLAAADAPVTGAGSAADYLARLPRLAALWIDREVGLLRWAPVLALCFLGAWLLWRSRRERLARLVAERRDAEHAAFLALAICAAQVLVAAFVTPRLGGAWFPGRQLVAALPCAVPLLAWGLRHAPRAGAALAGLTALSSGWLLVVLHADARAGWAAPGDAAPWGPLDAALPRAGSATFSIVAAALAAALVVLVALDRRRRRFVADQG